MSNQSDHTIVRLRVPPELKKQIEESADKNNRSQSAEMVARLEQSFFREFLDKPNISAELDEIQKRIAKQDLVLEKLLEISEKYQSPKK